MNADGLASGGLGGAHDMRVPVASDDCRECDRGSNRARHHDGGGDAYGNAHVFVSLADNLYRETYRQRGPGT